MHTAISPLWIDGNVRDMKMLNFANGKKKLVVSRNNEPVGIYQPN
jgi:hypothetical protein